MMTTGMWVILVILILIFVSRLSRLLFKTDIYLGFLIMIRTKRYLKYLKRLSRPKILDYIADFGVITGFGAFGLDYIVKRKIKSKLKRVIIFILSTAIFSYITYILASGMLFNSGLITKEFAYFMIFASGLMGFSGFTLASLVFSAYDIVSKLFIQQTEGACPGVGLVIPGVKMPKTNFFIPWYGWIILIFSAIIHEFSHGAMLKRIKAKVKSMGFILATILPLGAFVEPDNKELDKKPRKGIIRMLSAGPTSNTILAIIFAIILLVVSAPIHSYMGEINSQKDKYLYVDSVNENVEFCGAKYDSPAHGKIEKNDIILFVNEQSINSKSDLTSAAKKDQNNTFVIKDPDTNKNQILSLKPNEVGRFGFTVGTEVKADFEIPWQYNFYDTLLSVLIWIALLNFIIATVNFLPSFPFDGGAMAQIIFSPYLSRKFSEEKRMKKVSRFFGAFLVVLLILNILPYFF